MHKATSPPPPYQEKKKKRGKMCKHTYMQARRQVKIKYKKDDRPKFVIVPIAAM